MPRYSINARVEDEDGNEEDVDSTIVTESNYPEERFRQVQAAWGRKVVGDVEVMEV